MVSGHVGNPSECLRMDCVHAAKLSNKYRMLPMNLVSSKPSSKKRFSSTFSAIGLFRTDAVRGLNNTDVTDVVFCS